MKISQGNAQGNFKEYIILQNVKYVKKTNYNAIKCYNIYDYAYQDDDTHEALVSFKIYA